MSAIFSTQALVKRFGAFTAVDGVDLELKAGECFGLLGPNGAGKSTVIGMIYGQVRRSAGEISVFGLDPAHESRAIKKRLGVVTQVNALDESLTVRENMMVYAAYFGMAADERARRVDELLAYMDLSQKADAPIRALSGGMQRRLVFLRALLGKPELLILDEPTTGLDPAVRHQLWGKVKELRSQGITILLTTHYMHEAEILCDRVAIMHKGKILAVDTPSSLIQRYAPGYVAVFSPEASAREKLEGLTKGRAVFTATHDHSGTYIRTLAIEDLLGLQKESPIPCLQLRPANLEDVFLNLTGQEIDVNA